MILAIIVAILFGGWILSDLLERSKSRRSHTELEDHLPTYNTPPPFPHYDPYHSTHGPVYSPDKRQFWDGSRWVPVQAWTNIEWIIAIIAVVAILRYLL